jgi:hypothetical protein
MKIIDFIAGVIVVILGGLMLIDGVVGWESNTSFIFADVDPLFEIVVGAISIVLAAPLLGKNKE